MINIRQLLISLIAALMVIVSLSGIAMADPPATGAPAAAGKASEPEDMFPGVRGISGEELQRRLAEYERRRQQTEPQRPKDASREPVRKPADNTPAPAPKPEQQPSPSDNAPDVKPPAGGAVATNPAEKRPARRTPPSQPLGPQVLDIDSLPAEQRDYLLALERQVEFMETILSKAHPIRKDAEIEAAKIGYEPRIQYYLRYQRASAPQTRAYEQTLAFPLYLYRFVVDQAGQVTRAAKPDKQPAGMPELAAPHIEKLLTRSDAARREALLAGAELYTRLRQLAAAEMIYAYLLHKYPKDTEIAGSHATFVTIRNEPKPAAPPMQRSTDRKSVV